MTGWLNKYVPGLGGILKIFGFLALVVVALWWQFSPMRPDWSWREVVFLGLVIAVLVLWQRIVYLEYRLDRLVDRLDKEKE